MLAQDVVHRRLDLDVQPRLDRQKSPPICDREISPGSRELPDPVVDKDEHKNDEHFSQESGALGARRCHVGSVAFSRATKMSLANGRGRVACR